MLSVLCVGLAFGGAGAIAAGISELGFILLSFAVMAWFAFWVLRQRLYEVALLVVMFLGGCAISWGIGFLGYRYLVFDQAVALGLPTNHTETTAVLVLLSSCATVAGGFFTLRYFRRNARTHPPSDHQGVILRVLPFFTVCYLVFQFISLQVNGLNARSDIGNYHQTGSASYLVAGLQMIAYPFYALLGLTLRPKVRSAWNLAVAIIIVAIIGLQSLTGGRTAAIEPLVVFLLGSTFSCVQRRQITLLIAAAAPLVLFLMIVLGLVRGTGGFDGGAVGDKVSAVNTVLMEGRNERDKYDDPSFVLFTRLFETSGQAVIDNVAETGSRVGFVNFERLLFVLVPRFAYPGKEPLNDGNERLAADYGYAISEYSSAPFPLLADSYERFGVLGVAFFHFFVGAFLGISGVLLCRVRERVLSLLLLICMGRTALLLYPIPVLGIIHLVFYGFLRDVLLVSLLYYSAIHLTKFLKSSRPSYGL